MIRRPITLAGLLALTLVVAACGSAAPAQNADGSTPIDVGTSSTLSNASLYYADSGGAFARHKLAAKLTVVQSGAAAIPPVALVPLALLLYGATTQMKLVLVVLGAVWPLLLQSMYGVHQVDPVAIQTARSYRLGRWLRTAFVILPSTAPFVFTGIRIAATMALLLTIGAEVIGGAPGLGAAMATAQTVSDIPRLFALAATSAVLGVLINTVLARVERRVLSWHVSQRPTHA